MLNGNVLIELQTLENKTASGIIIPSTTQTSFNVAKVVSIPADQEVLKKDDTVYIPLYGGSEIQIEGKRYFIINIRDIILIV